MDKKIIESEEKLMLEAIRLAGSINHRVCPNPRTGALVLRNGEIIGRGCHEYYGGPHAEVNAIQDAGKNLKGCDMVVTLEPCCHTGKTPPCTDLIIASGIKKVIIGMEDPNPQVAGKGIRQLQAAGIEIVSNVLADECAALNQPFIKMMTENFPYIIVKSAITLDGYIADEQGQSKWISSAESRKIVHEMRANADAVLVGVGTVFADDPELTVRDAEGEHPLRVAYDPEGVLPDRFKMIRSAKEIPTTIITGPHSTPVWKYNMRQNGTQIIETDKLGNSGLEDGLRQLGEQGIQSILVEGGGRLQSMLAELGCIDRLEIFIAAKLIGKGIRMMEIPPRAMDHSLEFIESTWKPSGPDMHFTGVVKFFSTVNNT
jgi:diaminohydroxyphosphoribosylaminopyrimidine deaminase/5-amino-6-(5-phosphoribosylamino)uracil reductase